jgi:peptidoglycan/xylan/chitin deacetylase (PgdA/CDA1 family)
MSFRLDRFASLYLVSPVMRLTLAKRSIPVLMYHSISDEDESGVHAYFRTTTSPAMFEAQLGLLHQLGYQTCSPMQARSLLQDPCRPARQNVVITFDDGYRDFYQRAFPALSRFGFTATVYLPTAFIADGRSYFKGRECLSWAEVRELQNHGITFGSHTVNHPQLHTLDRDTISREISGSKNTIEEKTGRLADSFAYPYAFPQTDAPFKSMLRTLLGEAGYSNGVCTAVGRATPKSDPYFMERIPMNSLDDEALLRAKLAGAYDWVGKSQSFFKKARRVGVRFFSRTQSVSAC